MSHSLWPHGLLHTRHPCPSPAGACSNSCPLSRCCHPTISFSVIPFSSCLQSFPSSGSFPMSWLFKSSGQSIGGASALKSVLPMNIQGCFPLELTVQGTFKSLLQHHNSKASILRHSAFFMVQFSYLYMTTGENVALTRQTFVEEWCLCFLNCCLGLSWLPVQGASF